MTLVEIKSKLENIDNSIEFLLNLKEKHKNFEVLLKRKHIKNRLGRHNYDELFFYTYDLIDKLCEEKKKNILIEEKMLKELDNYDEIKKKIIEYREVNKYSWQKISLLTYYSESQCRNIYRKYKNKCYVED